MWFRFWRKREDASLPKTHFFNDIFLIPKKKLLDLHKRYLVIRIDTDFFKSFFASHHHLISLITFFLIIAIVSIFYGFTQASVATFYPTTCLGGWEHPENIEGEPSLSSDASASDFNLGNSAHLQSSSDALYCGGFKGEIPDNTKPTHFRIFLHLSVDDGSVVHQEMKPFGDIILAPTENPAETLPITPPDSSSDSTTTPAPTPDSTPTTPVVPPPDNQAQSFLDNFFAPKVFADDNATDGTDSLAPATDATIPDNTTPDVIPPVPADTNNTTPAPAPAVENPDNALPSQAPSDAFLEVDYTLDGATWNSLGTISRSSWQNNSFDIPITEWTNLDHLQISIKTLPTFDNPLVVYLDSIEIFVEYDDIPKLIETPTVIIKDPSNIISSDKNDFSSNEQPTFTITNPNLNTDDLKILVDQNKAEVVSDPNGALSEPTEPETEALTPEAVLKPVMDSVDKIITPHVPETPDTLTPEPVPDVQPSIPASDAPVSVNFLQKGIGNLFSIFKTKKSYASGFSNISASVLDIAGNSTSISAVVETVVVNGAEQQQVKVQKPSRAFRPGRYRLKISMVTSQATIISMQDFTWGVLAINTDKSVYEIGDDAYLQMGVLDDNGNTICDAGLNLDIKSPTGAVTHFSTDNGSIVADKKCGPNNVINVPDYYAHFAIPNIVGAYDMTLIADTANGTKKIIDSFEVLTDTPFIVQRTGPTRIFPVSTYPMTIQITSDADWAGTVTEEVPASFEISEPDHSVVYDKVETSGDTTTISWSMSLLAGQEMTLGYHFKAPPISPEFYLLGKIKLIDSSGTTSFEETRNWQIASDTTYTWTGTTSTAWATTTNWSPNGNPGSAASDVVIIPAVTNQPLLTVAPANALASLTFTGTATLTITTVTLTVTGAVANSTNAATGTITGTGTLTCGSISIGNGAGLTFGTIVLNNNGTTTVGGGTSGTLTLSSATGIKTFIGLVTINTGATWTESAAITPTFRGGITNNNTFTASTGIHTFDTNAQALTGTFSIPSVTVTTIVLTNNNSLTVSTALAGTGTLSNAATGTLAYGAACSVATLTNNGIVTSSGTGTTTSTTVTNNLTFNMGSTGTVTAFTNAATGVLNITATPTVATITTLTVSAVGNTVNYTASGAQTVRTATTFYNLGLSGSGAKTMTGVTTLTKNFSMSGAATATTLFTTIGGNVSITGTAVCTAGASNVITGSLTVGDGTNIAGFTVGAFTLSVGTTTTVNNASTITFSSVTNPIKTFIGLVTINTGATWTESAAITPTFRGGITNNNTFTASTGIHTFDTNAQALTGTFSIPSVTVTTIVLTNNNSLTVSTALAGTGTLSNAATGTLAYGAACSVATLTNNGIVTSSGTGTTTSTTVTNNLTFNMGSTGTVTAFTNAATGVLNITATPTVATITTLTVSAVGNTVNYTASGAQTVRTATTFYNLGLSGSGAKTMTGVTTLTKNFSMSGAATATTLFTTIGGDVSITGTANLTTGAGMTIAGTVTVGDGTSLILGAFTFAVSGTTTIGGGASGIFTATSGTGITFHGDLALGVGATWTKMVAGTVVFSKVGGGTQILTSNALNPDLGNIQVSASGGVTTLNLGSHIKATNITIDASQILDVTAAPFNIILNGSWTNNGGTPGFNARTGTVTLATSATATLSGTTTFNNFSVSGIGAAKTLTFVHQTANSPIFTFAGTVTLTGASGQLITVNSDSVGTQWLAHFNANQSVTFVSVKDSGCDAGSFVVSTDVNSTLSTNNGYCWNPTITFSNSDSAVGFGALSSLSVTYANGTAIGSITDVTAHTFTIATSAVNGYTLSYIGPTLTGPGGTILVGTGIGTGGTAGTSQFAMSGTLTGTGTGAMQAGYNHATPLWSYVAGVSTVLASSTGPVASDVIDMHYEANILPTTPAGSYTTTITYLLTGNF